MLFIVPEGNTLSVDDLQLQRFVYFISVLYDSCSQLLSINNVFSLFCSFSRGETLTNHPSLILMSCISLFMSFQQPTCCFILKSLWAFPGRWLCVCVSVCMCVCCGDCRPQVIEKPGCQPRDLLLRERPLISTEREKGREGGIR